MKKLLIIISLLILLLLLVIIWFVTGLTRDESDREFSNLSSIDTTRVDVPFEIGRDQKTKIINTEQGEVIVRDIITLPSVRKSSEGYYNVEPFSADDYFPDYNIVYAEGSDTFSVSLNKEPLRETRLEAENYLQVQLGISQADMCRLKTLVGVPFDVNPALSGQNLGFSFCPGSVALE